MNDNILSVRVVGGPLAGKTIDRPVRRGKLIFTPKPNLQETSEDMMMYRLEGGIRDTFVYEIHRVEVDRKWKYYAAQQGVSITALLDEMWSGYEASIMGATESKT